MIEVFKVFYPTHYNFAAVTILLVLLLIYLLSKKNFKWSIITLVLLLAFNIAIYKRTDGRTWTITVEPEKSSDPYYTPQVKKMTFSVKKDWTITDEKGEVHHWCWVEDYWQKFASMDLVATLWGENSSKKMVQSSEGRVDNVGD
ncbi:MAG: hypothetical protein II565_06800 [Fibrobacter sp.]|nr:hypothetical protein [Fibrobacter sp.]MBQ5463716.1 hypothetical protein [Fibrobacter sp.]